ncbi:unnamed protein product [Victoria cruziana]
MIEIYHCYENSWSMTIRRKGSDGSDLIASTLGTCACEEKPRKSHAAAESGVEEERTMAGFLAFCVIALGV